jgi:transcriptional regulator with XRE-family HTH domain
VRKPSTLMEKVAAKNLARIFEEKKYGPERLTQAQLADKVGFKQQSAISQYLTGKNTLGVEAIVKFAVALQVPPEAIRPDFYDILPLTKTPRATYKVNVRESVNGTPVQGSITVAGLENNDPMSYYAVLVDTEAYRKARIRANSHLVVKKKTLPSLGDDTYVILKDGTRYIAIYQGPMPRGHIIECLASNETLRLRSTDIASIEVITSIESPTT